MTRRFRPLVPLAAASLLVAGVLRATLWWQFGRADRVDVSELPAVLARSLLNDLVVSLCAFAPFALCLALVPDRWMRSRVHRVLVPLGSWLTLFTLAFLAVVERRLFRELDAIAAALIAGAGVFLMRRWP